MKLRPSNIHYQIIEIRKVQWWKLDISSTPDRVRGCLSFPRDFLRVNSEENPLIFLWPLYYLDILALVIINSYFQNALQRR